MDRRECPWTAGDQLPVALALHKDHFVSLGTIFPRLSVVVEDVIVLLFAIQVVGAELEFSSAGQCPGSPVNCLLPKRLRFVKYVRS